MLADKRITVTGGKGFLGQHLIRKLADYSCRSIDIADLPQYNLTDLEDIRRMFDDTKPDIIVHPCAKVGGIGFNGENQRNFSTATLSWAPADS